MQVVITAFAVPAVRHLVDWDAQCKDSSLLGATPLCLAAVTNSSAAVVVSVSPLVTWLQHCKAVQCVQGMRLACRDFQNRVQSTKGKVKQPCPTLWALRHSGASLHCYAGEHA